MTLLRNILFATLLVFGLNVSAAKNYTLLKVADGDTVTLTDDTGKFRLRLTGIDAPERNQAYGKKSRRALIKLCQTHKALITAKITGTDKYNRALGRLYCNGTDVSLYLAEKGLAWHNYKYSNDLSIFIAHLQAKYKGIGLWQQQNPVPPWEWRKRHNPQYTKKNDRPSAKH